MILEFSSNKHDYAFLGNKQFSTPSLENLNRTQSTKTIYNQYSLNSRENLTDNADSYTGLDVLVTAVVGQKFHHQIGTDTLLRVAVQIRMNETALKNKDFGTNMIKKI